jgi:hypothetical protein
MIPEIITDLFPRKKNYDTRPDESERRVTKFRFVMATFTSGYLTINEVQGNQENRNSEVVKTLLASFSIV